MENKSVNTTIKKLPNAIFLEEVRHQLQQGHTATFRVYGYSMRPFLENGRDKVLLIPPRALSIGDVALVLTDDNRYVLHRVVGVDADGGCTLFGDGNLMGREHASAQNIIGVAKGFYRADTYYDCRSRPWRLYSSFWMHTVCIRRWMLRIYRALYKCRFIKH